MKWTTPIVSALVIVFVIATATSAYVFAPSHETTVTISASTTTSSMTSHSNVTVFGLVSTTGTGTHPAAMTFVSSNTRQSFTVPVIGSSFSIQLPNSDMYAVSMRWIGNYSWQTGEIQREQLLVNMSEGSMMSQSYNVVETTPNSVVVVSGVITWQIVTARPTNINFTATNGEQFLANVLDDKTFSITLPNMMTYEVNVGSQNASGYTEWYYAHGLEVNAGAKVVGLAVELAL